MGEIPLRARAEDFLRRIDQQAVRTPPLTEPQREVLRGEATPLLNRLIRLASPSLVAEEIVQREKRELVCTYLTPAIRVIEEGEDPEKAPAFAIFVEKRRSYNAFPLRDEEKDIGPEEVSAMVLMVSEQRDPLPIINLEGQEAALGNFVCTKVGTTDGFFVNPEEAESGPADQLDAIRETARIIDKISPALESGAHTGVVRDGEKGHILVIRDYRHGKQEMFIPHSVGRAV